MWKGGEHHVSDIRWMQCGCGGPGGGGELMDYEDPKPGGLIAMLCRYANYVVW